ncbi:MAG: acyl carrier protein [Clostridia bacterium]|nr:acyl carrier protein [Clostridia bacterium]
MHMVFEKIRAILAEQFGVEEDSIKIDTNLTEDLGADSLDFADVVMAIEDEFDVEIPDEDIESIKTVGDIVEYIEAHK